MITAKTKITRRHNALEFAVLLSVIFALLYLLIKPFQSLDSQIVTWLPLQVPGLDSIMLVITTIGSPVVIPVIVIAWTGVELAWNARDRAVAMLMCLLASPVFYILKTFIHRARPVSKYVEILNIHSYSFPSGHATMSIAVFLTLAQLISLRLPQKWARLITAIFVVLIVLIGISRVYLGAHFPTDVIGGWIIGGIVLLLIRAYLPIYQTLESAKR